LYEEKRVKFENVEHAISRIDRQVQAWVKGGMREKILNERYLHHMFTSFLTDELGLGWWAGRCWCASWCEWPDLGHNHQVGKCAEQRESARHQERHKESARRLQHYAYEGRN